MSTEATAGSSVSAEERERRIYELSYLLAPSLDESGRSAAVESIRAAVEGEQGTIINEVFPDFLELAYPMDHFVEGKRQRVTSAYFGWLFFEVLPERLEAIREALSREAAVVRFLLVAATQEQAHAATMVNFRRGTVTASEVREDEKAEEKSAPEAAPLSEEEVDRAIEDLVGEEKTPPAGGAAAAEEKEDAAAAPKGEEAEKEKEDEEGAAKV